MVVTYLSLKWEEFSVDLFESLSECEASEHDEQIHVVPREGFDEVSDKHEDAGEMVVLDHAEHLMVSTEAVHS